MTEPSAPADEPQPYVEPTHDGDPGGTGIDWRARFAEDLAEHDRRKAERIAAREEFAEARRHGLAARHARKLGRRRG